MMQKGKLHQKQQIQKLKDKKQMENSSHWLLQVITWWGHAKYLSLSRKQPQTTSRQLTSWRSQWRDATKPTPFTSCFSFDLLYSTATALFKKCSVKMKYLCKRFLQEIIPAKIPITMTNTAALSLIFPTSSLQPHGTARFYAGVPRKPLSHHLQSLGLYHHTNKITLNVTMRLGSLLNCVGNGKIHDDTMRWTCGTTYDQAEQCPKTLGRLQAEPGSFPEVLILGPKLFHSHTACSFLRQPPAPTLHSLAQWPEVCMRTPSLWCCRKRGIARSR